MKIAYADPPYLGMCSLYGHEHGETGRCWDSLLTHQILIRDLSERYDRWALSLHTPSLQAILPLCPPDVRVLAWCKPFASWKKGVRVAYCWEPVIVRGAPNSGGDGSNTVRDFQMASITLRRGFAGAKPEAFCHWLFDVLQAGPDDEFFDVFPGSGAVTEAWRSWIRLRRSWGS